MNSVCWFWPWDSFFFVNPYARGAFAAPLFLISSMFEVWMRVRVLQFAQRALFNPLRVTCSTKRSNQVRVDLPPISTCFECVMMGIQLTVIHHQPQHTFVFLLCCFCRHGSIGFTSFLLESCSVLLRCCVGKGWWGNGPKTLDGEVYHYWTRDRMGSDCGWSAGALWDDLWSWAVLGLEHPREVDFGLIQVLASLGLGLFFFFRRIWA